MGLYCRFVVLYILQSATEDWNAIAGTYGGVEPYLEVMSKQSTHADGIIIAAAVDLYERTFVIIQDDGVRIEFTYERGMSHTNIPIYLGYVKAHPSDASRNHYLSLHPKHLPLESTTTTGVTAEPALPDDQKSPETVCA